MTLITPNIIIILLQYSTNKAWNIQPTRRNPTKSIELPQSGRIPKPTTTSNFQQILLNSRRPHHHPSSNGREHPDSITPFPSPNRFIDPAKDKKKTEQIEKETKKERRGEIPRSYYYYYHFKIRPITGERRVEDGFIATPGISLLDRSKGRHKGRREKMEGRASLERSRTRIPRMQTSRASGGSSRGSRY